MSNNTQPNVNRQDHPHQEGQQNNTAATGNGGQHRDTNDNQPMSNMRNENDAQRGGDKDRQKDESDVQQGERTP